MNLPEKPPDGFKHLLDKGMPDYQYWTAVEEINREWLPWDEVKRPWRLKRWKITDPVALWGLVQMSRASLKREIPLTDKNGSKFTYSMPDAVLEGLHRVDKFAGGEIASPNSYGLEIPIKYLSNSSMEEAIASSQLEGAATTRKVAKDMLRSGRKPRTYGEKMISNNHEAMQRIKSHLRESSRPMLTIDFLHELHAIVTQDTLKDSNDSGSFRSTDDVVVVDTRTEEHLHHPPSHESIEERIQSLINFVNGDTTTNFLYPVIRGIILHFMIGYIHPYRDGNGRLARALFYWCMLRQKYWVLEYLAISRMILESPAQYKMAYLYSEADSGDLTYFIIFHLKILDRAIQSFKEFIEKKRAELLETRTGMATLPGFNRRQTGLLRHALSHPDALYTIDGHAVENDVTRLTARKDLYDLLERTYLRRSKDGRRVLFSPDAELREKLRDQIKGSEF